MQSAALPQWPQAPPVVHTSGLIQSSGDVVHALQVFVAASQIGVLPVHPAFICDGSHCAHCPATHRSLPSVLPAQSVESLHAEHAAGGPATQNRSALCPLHTRFEPGAHSHLRAVHAAATPVGTQRRTARIPSTTSCGRPRPDPPCSRARPPHIRCSSRRRTPAAAIRYRRRCLRRRLRRAAIPVPAAPPCVLASRGSRMSEVSPPVPATTTPPIPADIAPPAEAVGTPPAPDAPAAASAPIACFGSLPGSKSAMNEHAATTALAKSAMVSRATSERDMTDQAAPAALDTRHHDDVVLRGLVSALRGEEEDTCGDRRGERHAERDVGDERVTPAVVV